LAVECRAPSRQFHCHRPRFSRQADNARSCWTSGRIFFVADYTLRKGPGPKREGAFAALSDNDGATWNKRELPGIKTVGYVTATQGPNGVIHIVTSNNQPHDVNIDLNEAWVLQGGPEHTDSPVQGVKTYQENFSSGKPRCTWSAGLSTGGNYLLEGKQTFFIKPAANNGRPRSEPGAKAETLWRPDSSKQWERIYDAGGRWTWLIYDAAGQLTAQSHWREKDLVEVR
jgi:hypothetical protein